MLIKELHLKNFRGISSCSIEFDKDYNIIVGRNGIGKTTVLYAVDLVSGWILSQIFGVGGRPSSKSDVLIGAQLASIHVIFEIFDQTHELQLAINLISPQLNIDSTDVNGMRNYQRFHKSVAQLKQQKNINWPLSYFFDQSRANLQASNNLRTTKHDKESAYIKDNYVLSHFSKWFDDRDAQEARWVRNNSDLDYKDPQLQAAKEIIFRSTGFKKIYFSSDEPAGIRVEKYNYVLAFDQLSSGEKTLLFLMGDLARRCGLLNNEKPFDVYGVVIIDEVELHLHPKWQRVVIEILTNSFPNIQFIISTHSPQVVGEIMSDKIRVISSNDEGEILIERLSKETYGRDTNYILNTVLGANERQVELKKQLSRLDEFISKNELDDAKKLQKKLEAKYSPDFPELAVTRIRLERRIKKQ